MLSQGIQVSIELKAILLSPPPNGWDYRCDPPDPAHTSSYLLGYHYPPVLVLGTTAE